MAIAVECGDCRKRYNVDPRQAGRRVKCKNCGNVIQVPGPPVAAAAAGSVVGNPSAAKAAAAPRRPGPPPARPAPPPPPPPPAEPEDPFANLSAFAELE